MSGRKPIPAAARLKAWVCGPLLAGVAGSNLVRVWMSECCLLSGRGLCDGLIPRPD